MLLILHGEHHLQSRTALTQAIATAQKQGRQIVHVEVKNLEAQGLTSQLATQSLFAEPRTLIIEELHSLPKSKRKEELISLLTGFADQPDTELILWEKKQVTATELKKFPTAKVQVFLPTRSMFTWLNALSGQPSDTTKSKILTLQKAAMESDGEHFCFAMLMRQVRLLIEAKEGGPAAAQFKIAAQAKLFSWSQLLRTHKQLLLIDEQFKTSASAFSVASQLELLILSL